MYSNDGAKLKSGAIDYINNNHTDFIYFSKIAEDGNDLFIHIGANSNAIIKINIQNLNNATQDLTYGKRFLFLNKSSESIGFDK